MAELEEIVRRKNYVLTINWDCEACKKRTDIVGCLLPGEYGYNDPTAQITWDDLLHKKCNSCNIIRKPLRKCNRCKSILEFDTFGCKECDREISDVIDIEIIINELADQIRRGKRKKENISVLENQYYTLRKNLHDKGYSPCNMCGSIYGKGDYFTCKDCLG